VEFLHNKKEFASKTILLLPDHIMHDSLNAHTTLSRPLDPYVLYKAMLSVVGEEAQQIEKENVDAKELIDTLEYKKILVVEDNLVNQEIIAGLLEGTHIEIIFANDGAEGIAKFFNSPNSFDLILMDIQMPIKDGYEATKEIRNSLIHNDIPIIALTANAMVQDIEKTKQAGMNAHLNKPIDVDEFYLTIMLALGYDVQNQTLIKKESAPSSLHINREKALAMLGNNEELYEKVSLLFYEEYKAGIDLLEPLWHKSQEEALRYIHSIKGLSASLGADTLNQYAIELEASMKKGLFNPELFEHFKKEFGIILNELGSSVVKKREISQETIAKIDKALPKELYLKLKDAIEHHQPKVIENLLEEIFRYKLSLKQEEILQKIKEFNALYQFNEVRRYFEELGYE
jgi:CheY-like chemotaxis protein